jgi:hypothetical protein
MVARKSSVSVRRARRTVKLKSPRHHAADTPLSPSACHELQCHSLLALVCPCPCGRAFCAPLEAYRSGPVLVEHPRSRPRHWESSLGTPTLPACAIAVWHRACTCSPPHSSLVTARLIVGSGTLCTLRPRSPASTTGSGTVVLGETSGGTWDLVSLNSMVARYVGCGDMEELAYSLFDEMP